MPRGDSFWRKRFIPEPEVVHRLAFHEEARVSPVIVELLLIVITVAIGTLVYSFASTAFGGFGAGFSNLVQNAGSQLTENVVVEQVYFLHNDTGIADSCGIPLECAGDIFIGNSGSNTATINDVFVTNVNSGAPLAARTSNSSHLTRSVVTMTSCCQT